MSSATETGSIPRLLVVDDEEVDRIALVRAFRRIDFECDLHMAVDGNEALALLQEEAIERPFMMLLDLNLPTIHGFKVLDAVRADPALRQTIVFVVSTSDRPSDIEAAYERGIAGYVVKGHFGADFKELARLIEQYWSWVTLPTT